MHICFSRYPFSAAAGLKRRSGFYLADGVLLGILSFFFHCKRYDQTVMNARGSGRLRGGRGKRRESATMDILHISYEPLVGWVYPILNALNESESEGVQTRYQQWEKLGLGDLAIAVTTKLKMLSGVVRRIDTQLQRLGTEFRDKDKIAQHLKGGYALRLEDNNLAYELLIDLDSFIFECRSTYEIIGMFLKQFFEQILQESIEQKDLIIELTAAGLDTRWIEILTENRKELFHNTAPWIAIDVNEGPNKKYELLILKKMVRHPSTETEWLRFDDLKAIYDGFTASLKPLQSFVIRRIQAISQ